MRLVMTHYPSLVELVHFESTSTQVSTSTFALSSEGSMVETDSPTPDAHALSASHPTLHYPLQYSDFIRDRHRSGRGASD